MKVLLITGRLAEHSVYECASQQNKVDFCVKVLPISVAALLTPDFVSRELKDEDLSDYDLILMPGLAREDTSTIEKSTGVPTFKGTRHASDLPSLLEDLGQLKLSKTNAADSIISDDLRRRTRLLLQDAERQGESTLQKPWNMSIGRRENNRLPIGRDYPMRVAAEILDAPILTDEIVLSRARYYVESGAGIIDIGMRAEEPRPDQVKRIVSLLKSKFDVPISLDSLNPEDIGAGIDSGVDLILSLNSSNIDSIRNLRNANDVAAVVIPERTEEDDNATPDDPIARVVSLEENIEKARQRGFRKIIADPIMDPLVFPGIVPSIIAARTFSKQHADVPLMFGVGNVTELLDADSAGANAVVSGIAMELGASILLTTEGSTKTRGAVSELAEAARMMYLARKRKTPPKDLSIDLLILKEKVSRELPYDRKAEEAHNKLKLLEAKRGMEPRMDPKGFFEVNIDRADAEIVVTHFDPSSKVPDVAVRGREPLEIRDTLVRMALVSTLEHAFYLGEEIQKAYTAILINRSYYQDEELFEQR
jgi:dihydropteroate synthase-like protein